MNLAESKQTELKSIVAENFGKIFESRKETNAKKELFAVGKKLGMNLIAVASIGLIIGFLVSFLI